MHSPDGGPAFPCPIADTGSPDGPYGRGMSLRDYVAARAMQGYRASSCSASPDDTIAQWAYKQADAMLKVRDEA